MDYKRFSDINRVIWVVARLQNIIRKKNIHGGNTELISPQYFKETENFVVKDGQKSIETELKKNDGMPKVVSLSS